MLENILALLPFAYVLVGIGQCVYLFVVDRSFFKPPSWRTPTWDEHAMTGILLVIFLGPAFGAGIMCRDVWAGFKSVYL